MNRKHGIRLGVIVALGLAALVGVMLAFAPSSLPLRLAVPSNAPMHTVAETTTASGQVAVTVETSRTYGWRIGTPIDLTIEVVVAPGTVVDLETLQQEVLTRQGGTWQMLAPPVMSSSTNKKGDVTWKIGMEVAFWVPNPEPFTAEFLVSQNALANGQAAWQYVSTPPVTFYWTPTAPANAQNIEQGPMGNFSQESSPEGYILIAAGGLLALLTPLMLLVPLWRRFHKPHLSTEVEKFWRIVNEVQEETRQKQWQTKHYSLIASALREYLGHPQSTTAELGICLVDLPQYREAMSAMVKLDRALYRAEDLTDADRKELMHELYAAVPRVPAVPTSRRVLAFARKLNPLTVPKRVVRRFRRKAN